MNFDLIKKNYDDIFFFLLLFFVFFSETLILKTLLPAYLFISLYLLVNISRIKLSLFQTIAFIVSLFYLISLIFLSENTLTVFINFKYFFGSIMFLIFLRNFQINQSHFSLFRLILMLVCIYTLFEAIIINIYPDLRLHYEIHTAKFFGFYTRSYGVGGNSTISSLSVIFLYYFIYKFYNKKISYSESILVILTIVSLFSTTGFLFSFLLIFIESIKLKKIKNFLWLFILFIIFFILYYLTIVLKDDSFQKISFDYIHFILNYKFYWFKMFFFDSVATNAIELYSASKHFIDIYETKECFNLLFGCQINDPTPNTSGDFAIKIFIKQNGFLGLFSFLLLIFSFFRSKNYLILLILISTTLHYGFIFSNIGHLILPLFLIFTFKNYSINKYIYD